MNRLKPISGELKYSRVIGTGGIGTGMFFQLEGNDTLGREESRMASLLPYRDYCKLHIMMHYISVLLGSKCSCKPIGSVGDDEAGRNLINEMQSVGIDTEAVKISKTFPTLFSVCYQYPNREGGNITTAESASSMVSAADVDAFFRNMRADSGKEIMLAVPEVPVQSRIRLLQYGRERKSLNVSAVSSSEIDEFDAAGGIILSDFLFINSDEAQKIAGTDKDFIPAAIEKVAAKNPAITLFITDG